MKKILSVLLSAAIITGVVGIGVCAEEREPDLGFAVASDLHYNVPSDELEGDIDDEIYWYANRRASMDNESGFIIDAFLEQCANDPDCDFVLIPGDMVDHGRRIIQEHYDVAEKFAEFEQRTGKQVYVIDGNHDIGNDETATTYQDFKRIYYQFGYDEALTTVEENCSYTANLGDKYRLIALDSCDVNKSTEDGLTTDRLSWALEQARQAKADGRYPILMMHHNLLDHLPIQRIISRNFIVRFHYSTAELLADSGVKLVFTGHEHCSDAATYTSALGNKIYDFATTALSMYPIEYRMFTLTDDEINYTAKEVESIDTDALTDTVSGYSDEQIALMNEDLNAYAKGFLKAGVRYRLELSLSMEKMGISPDAFYYDIVKTAVDGLTDILKMPLYGENSVQALAAEYDIDIPDSDYQNAWDLATELVSAHYAGSEAYDLESTEVTIFLRTIALILRTDLAAVSDEIFFKAANALLADMGIESIADELTKLGVSVFGPVTPGEYFLLAVASPLIYKFAYDSDGVDDNNGTLEGYGTTSIKTNVDNISENIQNIKSTVALYINMFLKYLIKITEIFIK